MHPSTYCYRLSEDLYYPRVLYFNLELDRYSLCITKGPTKSEAHEEERHPLCRVSFSRLRVQQNVKNKLDQTFPRALNVDERLAPIGNRRRHHHSKAAPFPSAPSYHLMPSSICIIVSTSHHRLQGRVIVPFSLGRAPCIFVERKGIYCQ